ncbi:Hsp20/alpha crystallin family protein [Candidatus Parcubacteria bacterium]|jgi:HSP20 family protein|nr:Hsp20/alpha crystallin family protein [Candidatus Parcubacteria bacterium]
MTKKKNKKEKEEEKDIYDNIEEEELEEDEELEEEGQLSVDVYQDKNSIIIKSTIAGVEPEDVDITFDNDMITIRGKRHRDKSIKDEFYFYQECYWGGFSRSIILPVEVQTDKIQATIKNGILTITLPKAKKKDVNIKVKDEN